MNKCMYAMHVSFRVHLWVQLVDGLAGLYMTGFIEAVPNRTLEVTR